MGRGKVFIIFIILALLLFSCAGCGNQQDSQGDETIQNQTNLTQDNLSTVETEETESYSEQTETKERKNYIPGLEAADIKLNLEQTWGLKFSGPRPGKDLAQDSGQTVDPDTGTTLICNIFETSPLHIQWVDFVINASALVGTGGINRINALAEGYFGYCATVPYDDAEPEKAKQWVEDNIENASRTGNTVSTQIGSVQFEMFGTEYFRTLRIKPTVD